MTSIEQEVLDIINDAIGGKYIGLFKVLEEDGIWTLMLHMNQEYAPMRLSYEGTYEQFKNFIWKELHFRKMQIASYFKAVQELPALVCRDNELELDYDTVIIT